MRCPPLAVPDGLWDRLAPLLPERQRRFRHPGRRPLDDRAVLNGILFVLQTGIAWEHLPQELGFGSGMTCWRRLRLWQQDGVWERVHALLASEWEDGGEVDWARADLEADPAPGDARPTRSTRAVPAGVRAPTAS
jgi:transposase